MGLTSEELEALEAEAWRRGPFGVLERTIEKACHGRPPEEVLPRVCGSDAGLALHVFWKILQKTKEEPFSAETTQFWFSGWKDLILKAFHGQIPVDPVSFSAGSDEEIALARIWVNLGGEHPLRLEA